MSLRLLFLRLNIQESACLQHLVAVGIPNDQNGNLHQIRNLECGI